jgi:ornithine cyclodeaminase/alanine dehydrogenase-like protein (mu-crystallin family)
MSALSGLRLIDADLVREALPMAEAIRAIRHALSIVDADAQPLRGSAPLARGQFLMMPGELDGFAGCKVLTVADPGHAQAGERIQGLMLLFDSLTLAPVALVDGTVLTELRTPAVSAAAADLVTPDDASTLSVFGTGLQARMHIDAMCAIRPIERVLVVGRTPEQAIAAASAWSTDALAVRAADADAAAACDIVVCATTASGPVLTAEAVPPRTTVVAIGSHEPRHRELPGDLLGRSQVLVEGRGVAIAEAGDVILAIAEGALDAENLITFREIADGSRRVSFNRPRAVKTCGMAWQDLVVAAAVTRNVGIHPSGHRSS